MFNKRRDINNNEWAIDRLRVRINDLELANQLLLRHLNLKRKYYDARSSGFKIVPMNKKNDK